MSNSAFAEVVKYNVFPLDGLGYIVNPSIVLNALVSKGISTTFLAVTCAVPLNSATKTTTFCDPEGIKDPI